MPGKWLLRLNGGRVLHRQREPGRLRGFLFSSLLFAQRGNPREFWVFGALSVEGVSV